VGVLELHDPPTEPRALARRSRVPVDDRDAVSSLGECRGEVEPGGTGAHDDDVHGFSTIEVTCGVLNT
jgi:hypothetical protein